MTLTTSNLARALGITKKTLLHRAEKEGWPVIKKQSGNLYIISRLPLKVRHTIMNSGVLDSQPAPQTEQKKVALFLQVSDKERERSVWIARLLFEAKNMTAAPSMNMTDFTEAYNAGMILPEIKAKLGEVSVKTLYRWQKEFRDKGADGLVRTYGLSSGGSGSSLSDIERYYLEYFWLDSSLPTMRYAYKMMQINAPDSTCSEATAARYLKSLPKPLVDYKRLGVTKFNAIHQPAISQDIERYKSLEKVVSDHHCLDFVVLYRGKLIRPWITVFQDFRSGMILGWAVSVAPSSFSIIAAYYMTVMLYGIPDEVLFDNGKDYRSKFLNGYNDTATVYLPEGMSVEETIHIQGAIPMIGSKVTFTEVYSGQSKGRLERTFGIFADYLSKPSGSYVGRDTTSRPEEVQLYYRAINKQLQRTEFPDWEWVKESTGAIVQYINRNLPSDGKGMKGKTRLKVFEENLPENIRQADKDLLLMALTRGERRVAKKSAVKIGGVEYFAEELFLYNGRDVIVRQKIYTSDTVTVTDIKGRLICEAVANYTSEGTELDITIKKIRSTRKTNLLKLAELGTHENAPAPEYASMIDVARNMYSQNNFPGFRDPLAELEEPEDHEANVLPLAVGSEHDNSTPKGGKKYKTIFDVEEA